MFGGSSRRRPPPTPLASGAVNPTATTAAASAYMSATNHNPDMALSSAAAAAALRARPHTPTNVAEVQTKRTARRRASMSSTGSGPISSGLMNRQNRLERSGSSASMSERTFRSPSRSPAPTAREHQPPVPQIPDSQKSPATSPRVMGVGMQNFHTASEKMRTERPAYHLGPIGDTSNVRRSDSIMRTPNSPQSIGDPQPIRSDSRSSVNFSYPINFRLQSPSSSLVSSAVQHASVSSLPSASIPNSPSNAGRRPSSYSGLQDKQQLVYDPNSRRMLPKASAEGPSERQMKPIAERPPRRRRDGGSRRGERNISKATASTAKEASMAGENKDLHEPNKQNQVIEPSLTPQETPPREQLGREATIPTQHLGNPSETSRLPALSGPESESFPSSLRKPRAERGSGSKAREPSPSTRTSTANIRAEPTGDRERTIEMGNPRQSSLNVLDVLDAIPTRQLLFNSPQQPTPQQSEKNDHYKIATAQNAPSTSNIDVRRSFVASGEQEAKTMGNMPVIRLAGVNNSFRRSSSNSPARQARFAPLPAEKLAVLHDPLPRSASPMKSAMKSANAKSRGSSPGDYSDLPDQIKDTTVSRRKPTRVSFNDHGTANVEESSPVTEVNSPMEQSPQGSRRTWFNSLSRSKRKEVALDVDNEMMKPRPALPSFESVRDKRTREVRERPLVRPLQPPYSSANSPSSISRAPSSSTLTDSEFAEEPTPGPSSDHAIGSLLSQDQILHNVANNPPLREPPAPVVTSIEACGYTSESLHGSGGEKKHHDNAVESRPSAITPSTSPAELDLKGTIRETSIAVDTPRSEQEIPETMDTQQQDIPGISVDQPSPMAPEHNLRDSRSNSLLIHIPGGFPTSGAGPSDNKQLGAAGGGSTENDSPPSTAISDPTIAVAILDKRGSLPQSTPDTTITIADPVNAADDESEESIYSDAYEDISDINPDGFMSLNAIVERAAHVESKTCTHGELETLAMPSVATKSNGDSIPREESSSQVQPAPPRDANDWEQAKAFWRSLTADKRRQLEIEAAEEAAADGDREDVSPVRRNSNKKQSPEQVHQTQEPPVKPDSCQIPLRDGQASQPASAQSQNDMDKPPGPNERTQSSVKPPPRPLSSHDDAARVERQVLTLSTSKSQDAAQMKPALQRRGSNASDSSFKRSHRHPSLSYGTVAFRKTMRQTSPIDPRPRSKRGSGRFSLRSSSPTGSIPRQQMNITALSSPTGSMRRTLRPVGGSKNQGARNSVHFPLFSQSSKAVPKNSQWTSRFEGSSDEDEVTIAPFQSRVHNSNDKEDKLPRPVSVSKYPGKIALHGSNMAPTLPRPTPVSKVAESSPELPDGDNNFMPRLMRSASGRTSNGHSTSHSGMGHAKPGAIGTSTLRRSRSGRGALAPSFTAPTVPTTKRRGSLFGMLRRNKRADDLNLGKIQRPEPVESAARRDTKLERDPRHLKELRGEMSSGSKLQKKSSVSRKDGSRFERPVSSGNPLLGRSAMTGVIVGSNNNYNDNSTGENRLSFDQGHNSNLESGYEVEDTSVESNGPLKKKKFGALRRMFRLDE
ncbi:hypothetical protein GGR50DRAFT_634589 [Xylaria sp. CBS 124048]|nr:hypothetical protein GGR50DRAFT_634589 [Xylaria sp. CBS 124048]